MTVSDLWPKSRTWGSVQAQPLKYFHLADYAGKPGYDKIMLKQLYSLYISYSFSWVMRSFQNAQGLQEEWISNTDCVEWVSSVFCKVLQLC